MSDLTLHLFGTPALVAGDGRRLRFPDRRSIACLAVLAVDGPTPRSRLATRLWDEQGDADARRNLRRELHRMREAGLDAAFAADTETVALAPGVTTDLAAFAAALAEADADRVLERVVAFTIPSDSVHGSGTYVIEVDADGDAAGNYSLCFPRHDPGAPPAARRRRPRRCIFREGMRMIE